MRLLRLVIQNFGSFKGKHEVNLANAGLTQIEGENRDDASATSNGAAKSTIPDALYWCLYGVTTHEPSAEGDEVVNDRVGHDCVVSVDFAVNDKLFFVQRGRQVSKQRHLFGAKHGVRLITYRGKKVTDLSKGSTRETQAEIVRVLGMSASTFRHAVLFGQSKAFKFVRLSDGEKKAVLDEMIGAELYALASERASNRLAEVTSKLGKAVGAYDLASHGLKRERENLTELERMADVLDTRANRDLAASVRRKRLELGKLSGVPEALESAETLLETSEERLRLRRTRSRDAADELAALEREINKLQSSLESFEKLVDNACPTCAQNVPKAHVKRATKSTVATLAEVVVKRDAAKENLEQSEVLTRVDAKTLAQAHRVMKEARAAHSNYRKLVAELEGLEAKLEATRDSQTLSTDAIKRKRRAIAKLKVEKRKQRKLVTKLNMQKAQLEFWREGFSTRGLRSLMMDSVLPFLNAKLEQYSNAITAGNIKVQFKTQRKLKSGKKREEFHVDVRNKYGAKTYKQSSIGERAKVDLVVGLALQDMAAAHSRVPVNVAFFDEAFEGLDPAGCSRVMSELSNIAKHRESIFVITHQEAFKAFVSRKITVIKEHGVSRIE